MTSEYTPVEEVRSIVTRVAHHTSGARQAMTFSHVERMTFVGGR